MKIFVTGGAGFIGSAVIRLLIQDTDHTVVNIDCLTYAGNIESLNEVTNSKRYVFEQNNITDRRALNRLFAEHKPDAVLHLAAESHVDRSIDCPDDFIQTNLVGTAQILEVSRNYWAELTSNQKMKFRFHHVSTDEVFGDLEVSAPSFEESTRYAPNSPYAASKAGSDHLVRAWHRTYGLPVLISNCSNNYGPYQFPEKLIPHMILNALAGQRLPVYGDGAQVRDWLYVEDHARALISVLEKGQIGHTYNVGGWNEQNNLKVVETICALLDDLVPTERPSALSCFSDLIEFVPDRPGHDRRYAINANKISQELSWRPRETFNSGVKKTINWYLENRIWWQRVLNGSYQLNRIGQTQSIT